ncbi:LamG-like jellyroll fold domain-containing protein [Paenibacillus sp. FSL R5-0810]|uniref:LamG-like jellyroll fold domain-containing protein n=1 Tax=Paenibacillus sp. FSL R5-0810 TaxID=2921659 RepID=UPI0030F8DDA5
MDQAYNVISGNIVRLRKQLGLTQEQLAGWLGVTYQAVSKWENGQSCPDIMLIPMLADLFGITIDELFGRSEYPIDLRNGLILEYLFNKEIKDSSGGEHQGFPTEVRYGPDRFGRKESALTLDGKRGFVEITQPPIFPQEAFSISVWCRYDDETVLRGWHSAILSQDGHNRNRVLQLSTKDAGIVLHGFLREPDLSFPARIVKDQWYHVVVTYSDSDYKMYVNGMLTAERKGSFTPYNNEPMYIGRKSTDEPYFFLRGSIDDLRIYNRALHAGEVKALCFEGGYKPVPLSPETEEEKHVPVLEALEDIRMTFPEAELHAAAEWYLTYFGFNVLMEEPGFYMLTLYNSPNLILECSPRPSDVTYDEASFIFKTNREIEELRTYLAAAGAAVEETRDEGFAWFLDVTDPFGRKWMLLREKETI